MRPVDFDGATRRISAPPDWDEATKGPCGALPVADVGGSMVSCWEPTPEERAAIALGAHVVLTVCGRVHPVVSLGAARATAPCGPPAAWTGDMATGALLALNGLHRAGFITSDQGADVARRIGLLDEVERPEMTDDEARRCSALEEALDPTGEGRAAHDAAVEAERTDPEPVPPDFSARRSSRRPSPVGVCT